MLQPSPLKEISSRDSGKYRARFDPGTRSGEAQGLSSKQRENFVSLILIFLQCSLSSTRLLLLLKLRVHLGLEVFSSGCSQRAFPQIDFWRTLTVQRCQL